jgi:hypothetical protein
MRTYFMLQPKAFVSLNIKSLNRYNGEAGKNQKSEIRCQRSALSAFLA